MRRLKFHSVAAFCLWPLLTTLAALVEARELPYYSVSVFQATVGALYGVFLLLPEIMLTATALVALTVGIFSRFGIPTERASSRILVCEALLVLVAIICGASLWYPGVLSHPLLLPLSFLPAATVTLILATISATGIGALIPKQHRLKVAATLMAVAALLPIAARARSRVLMPRTTSPQVVVLGLDSISQADPVSHLSRWVTANGGTWYSTVVAPGLLTNATWASVLTMSPVSEHGVFHTFQRFPAGGSRLLEAARSQGYRTVSFFPDQLTSAVGSEAGFDIDLSGPVGWRQIVLPIVANASILLPMIKPLVPRFGWMSAPPNLAGTFTYDLRRDIDEILTSGGPGQLTLVVAHLTYLHLPVYPSYVDLPWVDKMRVATTAASRLRDRSFDWQDIDTADDPVKLRLWKLARLQETLIAEVERTGFLAGGGKLLIFSDHGHRRGLTVENFSDERFHRVVLATLGLTSGQRDQPVSLMNIGALLGLAAQRSGDPIVEFTLAPPDSWPTLLETARLSWEGRVDLDERLLAPIRDTLRQYRPSYSTDTSKSGGPS